MTFLVKSLMIESIRFPLKIHKKCKLATASISAAIPSAFSAKKSVQLSTVVAVCRLLHAAAVCMIDSSGIGAAENTPPMGTFGTEKAEASAVG